MGRVVLACKNDEERKMATCPVFAPYSLHTDRQAESVRHCVGFRSGITGLTYIKSELDSSLGEFASWFTKIEYWVLEFERGRMSCQGEHRSGRLRVRELADMVGISKNDVHCTLTENLDMKKLCARWVSGLLTMEQKERREDVSIECLAMFHSNKTDFLRQFISMDETWVHHFTPETRKQSKQWAERRESTPKKVKTVSYTTGKVMASVFWDAHGIFCTDYLQKGKTINCECWANILQGWSDKTKKICPLSGHILIARSSLRSQVRARLGRAIWSSRSVMLDGRAARSVLSGPRASRSFLCSSHTFKFIYYNLILKLKPIL